MKNEMNLESIITTAIEAKMYILKDKPHCQKYLEIRHKTDNIFNKMLEYYANDNYNFAVEFEKISKIIYDESTEINKDIVLNWQDDKNILIDLILFKNCSTAKWITSEFLSKNLYENEEEKEILECMLKSQISIYKIIKCYESGFVEIQDLITNKRMKIVVIASSLGINNDIYILNRIISYNGISFGTGLDLITTSNNKEIDNYLKYRTKNKFRITIIMELRSIINRQNKGSNKNLICHYYK